MGSFFTGLSCSWDFPLFLEVDFTLPSSGEGKRTAVSQYEVRNFRLAADAPGQERT